jgi:hypothetical protein
VTFLSDDHQKAMSTVLPEVIYHGLRHPLDAAIGFVRFFTAWSLILVALHPLTHAHVNLLFVSWCTMALGAYMTYVSPRFYDVRIGDRRFTIRGWDAVFVDFAFHVLPFVCVWFMYLNYYTSCDNFVRTLPLTLAIMLLYRISRSPVKTYVIRQRVATGFSLVVAAGLIAMWRSACA